MCIDDEEYTVSLDLRKVYRVLPDADAAAHGMIRIIDNSGEDYLFESDRFLSVDLTGIANDAFDALMERVHSVAG